MTLLIDFQEGFPLHTQPQSLSLKWSPLYDKAQDSKLATYYSKLQNRIAKAGVSDKPGTVKTFLGLRGERGGHPSGFAQLLSESER